MRLIKLLFGAVFGVSIAGAAQAVPLMPVPVSLDVGNARYTITSCNYSIATPGGTANGITSAGAVSNRSCDLNASNGAYTSPLQFNVSGNGVSITSTSGFLAQSNGTAGSVGNISLTMSIQALNGSLLSGVTSSVAGTGANFSTAASVFVGGTANLLGNIQSTQTLTTGSLAFATQSSVSLSTIDSAARNLGGGSAQLTSFTYSASTVPEPATIGLLAVAGFGLVAARRRRTAV